MNLPYEICGEILLSNLKKKKNLPEILTFLNKYPEIVVDLKITITGKWKHFIQNERIAMPPQWKVK